MDLASTPEIQLHLKIRGPNLDREDLTVRRQGLRAGRSSDGNTLTLDHSEISRHHMRITWHEDDYFMVEDLNSTNGVWLNDTRLVPRVPVRVNIGDTIRLGPYLITVESVDYAQPTLEPRQIIAGEPDTEDLPLMPTPSMPTPPYVNGRGRTIVELLPGLPRLQSTWLEYLPAIYQENDFIGRFMLLGESMVSPIIWMIDNFDLYLDPEIAPEAWLQWLASWFDLLLLPELPVERQRRIMRQIGWLFLRRGTPAGLHRLLELYFDVLPEIIEDDHCHFTVRLPLSQSETQFGRQVAERLIDSQRPAFASYTLEIT